MARPVRVGSELTAFAIGAVRCECEPLEAVIEKGFDEKMIQVTMYL